MLGYAARGTVGHTPPVEEPRKALYQMWKGAQGYRGTGYYVLVCFCEVTHAALSSQYSLNPHSLEYNYCPCRPTSEMFSRPVLN